MNSRLLPIADTTEVRAYAKSLVTRHPRELTATIGLYGLAAVAGLVGPRLLGQLVQDVQNGTASRQIDSIAAALIGFVIVQTVLTHYAYRAAGRFGTTLLAELREEFVEKVLALPLSTVENAGSGDLINRASRDVDALRQSSQFAVPSVLVGVTVMAFTLGATLLTSPLLSLSILVIVLPTLLASRWYLSRATAGYLRESAAYAGITDSLSATAEGATTIEAFGLQARRIAHADDAIKKSYEAERYTLRLRSVFFPVQEFTYTLPVAVSLLFGGYAYTRGWVNLAQVTAVTLYIQQLSTPLSQLLEWLDTLQVGGASLARLLGVAQVRPDRDAGSRAVADPRRLVAAQVHFGYTERRDVLHGVELTVRPGERFAMVGPSGAGKSTLGRLLAGIHGPRTGSVQLGGAPLIELPLDELRGEVVLVTQDHHVFAGPLRDNLILAAAAEATDEQLWAALAGVDAQEWARALPDGLDTRVGSGGAALSPPQAQQLALARILLADPRVLVLDEATALLDPRAARHLERSLSAVLEGRTVIAIAHRLHTAHDADRVAVVEDGRITELGSHHDLIEADGAYARLWDSWHGEAASVSPGGHQSSVRSEAL
ncbi:MAG TPA: ABC transporter ATP-binding protein [Actinocrinis sp.]|nr:ABC transporter ATP-binding protein [Actinocrinis sp.]